jgi:hypothetical protein
MGMGTVREGRKMSNPRTWKLGFEIEGTRLTPIRFSHMGPNGRSFFVFRCRCGVEKAIQKSNVRNVAAGVKSCGCLRREVWRKLGKAIRANRKGCTPWNKGLTYSIPKKQGRPSWKRGRVKLVYPNGRVEWVKVSEEKIGTESEWYVRPSRAKKMKRKV